MPGEPGRDLRDRAAVAGLDESVFATPPEAPPTPVPDTLLSRLLKAAGRERARRRWLSTGLGLLAAACAIALIVIVVPSSSDPKPAPRAMAALLATPVHATIALQPRPWGTEIDLTCWHQRGAAEPPSDRYELVAHGADGATTTWAAGSSPPAGKSSSPAAPRSPGHRSRTSRSPSPTGLPSSRWGGPPLPDRRSLVRPAGRSPAPANRGPALATGQDGPGESRKVAGVVDAMDGGKSTAVPLDLVNAGGTEI